MLAPKNKVSPIRGEVLVEVVKSFAQDKFADADKIVQNIVPDDAKPVRGSIERDREVVKQQCMAAMGFCPQDEDTTADLASFGARALERTTPEEPRISVIKAACDGCMSLRYTVTNMCRGCVARPCEANCPRAAISVEKQAVIDQTKCVKCGICSTVCPYGAINKAIVPCEDACPVGALSKDENGKEQIDPQKCIHCGKCVMSCPFGAIVQRSQMVDVLNKLADKNKRVVAMLAPAFLGQFAGQVGNVVSALKKIGFSDVVEVAIGAEVTTVKEAAEFVERMHEGKPFMTTSCCPAYVRAAKLHMPEILPFVSDTKSPMYYSAEMVKKADPQCVSVFVGPCMAKRVEAAENPNVDYVLIFEEIAAMFAGLGINVAECEAQDFAEISSSQGRQFPLSGGVAGAVASIIGDKADYRPEKIDGLNKDNVKLIKRYAAKGFEGNMLEVMCCEGGCIAGPGCVALAKKAAKVVENYVKEGLDLKNK